MKIGKYEFDSKSAYETKLKALGTAKDEDGNDYPTHSHSLVALGNIVVTPGEYDEEGNETKAPVLSDKYHVDVMWDLSDTYDEEGNEVKADHPYGWKQFALELQHNRVHMFAGVDYVSNTF